MLLLLFVCRVHETCSGIFRSDFLSLFLFSCVCVFRLRKLFEFLVKQTEEKWTNLKSKPKRKTKPGLKIMCTLWLYLRSNAIYLKLFLRRKTLGILWLPISLWSSPNCIPALCCSFYARTICFYYFYSIYYFSVIAFMSSWKMHECVYSSLGEGTLWWFKTTVILYSEAAKLYLFIHELQTIDGNYWNTKLPFHWFFSTQFNFGDDGKHFARYRHVKIAHRPHQNFIERTHLAFCCTNFAYKRKSS